jgi:hypothetical protein
MTFNGSIHPTELISNSDSGLIALSQALEVHIAGASQESSRKKGNSEIWKHFEKAADYETSKKVDCIHCNKSYVCRDGTTGNMWRHVKNAHPRKLGVPVLADGPIDRFLSGVPENVPYSLEAFKEVLVNWIVKKGLPFTVVEDDDFHAMIRMLRSGTKVPSANTIKNRIMDMFNAEKARVRALLQETPGKLSFSIDVWTSVNMEPFLGITVHWIDKEWRLQDMLLDLVPLEGPHTGKMLCAAFVGVCSDFGILTKLLAVTSDNASSNSSFATELESICKERNIPFTRADSHVRCMAHVIHLAVQTFLKALNIEVPDTDDDDDRAAFCDSGAGRVHFISRLRKLVVKIKLSPQRLEKFARACKMSNVAERKLVLDVKTRWSSTFLMLERALELREPLDAFVASERDLRVYQLVDEEWFLLDTIRDLLQVFKEATDELCASAYPTLTTTIPIYDCILDKIKAFADTHSESRALVEAAEAAKKKLETYYTKSNAAVYPVATVLDPRFKLQYYREHNWDPQRVELARDNVERVVSMYPAPAAQDASASSDNETTKKMGVAYIMSKRQRIDPPDELHDYLTARPAVATVDVLQWWKTNWYAYPRLSDMARDYLAVPATGAPVERVFSGGANLVSPKRGRLAAGTIRACLCLKSWRRFPK